VQVYFYFFSLAKIIKLAKKVDKQTFSSIFRPWDDPDSVIGAVADIKHSMKQLILRYVPWITTIPLYQGMSWYPTWKALPTHRLTQRVWIERMRLKGKNVSKIRSIFTSLPHEIAAFQFLLVGVHSLGEQWSQGCLWAPRIRYAFDTNNKVFTGSDLDWF